MVLFEKCIINISIIFSFYLVLSPFACSHWSLIVITSEAHYSAYLPSLITRGGGRSREAAQQVHQDLNKYREVRNIHKYPQSHRWVSCNYSANRAICQQPESWTLIIGHVYGFSIILLICAVELIFHFDKKSSVDPHSKNKSIKLKKKKN